MSDPNMLQLARQQQMLPQVEAEVLGQTGRFAEAFSCSLQATSSEAQVTAGPSADDLSSAPSLSITSAGSFPGVRAAACPARLQPLLALLPSQARAQSAETWAAVQPPHSQSHDLQQGSQSNAQPPVWPSPAALGAPSQHGNAQLPECQQPDEGTQSAAPEQPPAGSLEWRCCLSGGSPWLVELVDEAGFCLAGLRLEGAAAQVPAPECCSDACWAAIGATCKQMGLERQQRGLTS